ncbi:hypothetical protein GF362_02505 [Candidatus Dojkabacteria bacterium]|nr:hypothetical protein [Candidatus Dojkabacteria bacterium]
MKSLDILIVILVILVLASGGFLGYLVYTNYFQENATNGNNGTGPTEVVKPLCIDADDDGYGENCALGPDCDDTEYERNLECKILEGNINLVGESVNYSVGDEVQLDVVIEDLVEPEEKLDDLKLRVDYDTNLLEFKKFEPNDSVIEPLVMDLDLPDKIGYDLIALTEGDGLKDGDKIGTLIFETKETGLANVKVSEDTRIARLFELEGGGGTVDIPIQ